MSNYTFYSPSLFTSSFSSRREEKEEEKSEEEKGGKLLYSLWKKAEYIEESCYFINDPILTLEECIYIFKQSPTKYFDMLDGKKIACDLSNLKKVDLTLYFHHNKKVDNVCITF